MENDPGETWGDMVGLPCSNVSVDLESSLTLPSLLPVPLGKTMKANCLRLTRDSPNYKLDQVLLFAPVPSVFFLVVVSISSFLFRWVCVPMHQQSRDPPAPFRIPNPQIITVT